VRTIRRLIYSEVLAAVLFVTLGFVSLFFFFDFVDDLPNVGRDAYRLTHSLAYVTLLVPSHLYELLPITVLIGTIFVMARMAQSSEFTILRTSGLGPWRALRSLLVLGIAFVLLTFAVGDYVAPMTDRSAQLLKARFQGRISVGQTGAWLKEKQVDRSFAVNIAALSPDGQMKGVRIFESDAKGFLLSLTQAEAATFSGTEWTLSKVERTQFAPVLDGRTPGQMPAAIDNARVQRQQLATLSWPTEITPEMVSVALLKPERMATLDLFEYIQHLEANGQTSQRYEIEFWRKVFYPLSCLVMVVLALPFAYLHFRSGGITTYMFGGVLIGISFFLLNNVFGYIGNLNAWWPWLTAAAPGLIYTVLSLGAFGWLVLRQ
jgi:lipopolysaccharide export system permease protein